MAATPFWYLCSFFSQRISIHISCPITKAVQNRKILFFYPRKIHAKYTKVYKYTKKTIHSKIYTASSFNLTDNMLIILSHLHFRYILLLSKICCMEMLNLSKRVYGIHTVNVCWWCHNFLMVETWQKIKFH